MASVSVQEYNFGVQVKASTTLIIGAIHQVTVGTIFMMVNISQETMVDNYGAEMFKLV